MLNIKEYEAVHIAAKKVLGCLMNNKPMRDIYTCNEIVVGACLALGFDVYSTSITSNETAIEHRLHNWIDNKGCEYKDIYGIDHWYSAFITILAKRFPEKTHTELRIEWVTWLIEELEQVIN